MQFDVVFVITCAVAAVQADLSCLSWGLISPVVGLFCYFEPTYFTAAANRTVAAVGEAVQSAENLVKFDLTHNPAVVAYNFIDQTNKGGIGQGGQYLENITQDFEDVAIGFGKETSNEIITILELTYWNDLSLCLISGAIGLALHSQKRIKKRISIHGTSTPEKGHGISTIQPLANNSASTIQPQPNNGTSGKQSQSQAAIAMARQYLSNKLKPLGQPAIFHINSKMILVIFRFAYFN